MYYRVEKSLKDIEFWGGARHRASLFTEKEFEILEDFIQNCFDGLKEWTETEINDFVWFDDDFIITELFGYEDIETFYKERDN